MHTQAVAQPEPVDAAAGHHSVVPAVTWACAIDVMKPASAGAFTVAQLICGNGTRSASTVSTVGAAEASVTATGCSITDVTSTGGATSAVPPFAIRPSLTNWLASTHASSRSVVAESSVRSGPPVTAVDTGTRPCASMPAVVTRARFS